jgi:hypothetical protein
MSTLYCSKCRDGFEPDDDHGWVTVEFNIVDDANRIDEYALCEDCWYEIKEKWGEPV